MTCKLEITYINRPSVINFDHPSIPPYRLVYCPFRNNPEVFIQLPYLIHNTSILNRTSNGF